MIGFSIAYERENLLARGYGAGHMREFLTRLARPLIRSGSHLAYGGHWMPEAPNQPNFTYDLLNLISAEQEDNSLGGPDSSHVTGLLFNHQAWPGYEQVETYLRAQWIHCCRIVRISQDVAGIPPGLQALSKDLSLKPGDDDARRARALFNRAVCLSKMRSSMLDLLPVEVPDRPQVREYDVPPISAGILLGGKTALYQGFFPGILEEALNLLRARKPLFIVGGLGGAAEMLAQMICDPQAPLLDFSRLAAATPDLRLMADYGDQHAQQISHRGTSQLVKDLNGFIQAARQDPTDVLQTGLSKDQTITLLQTRDLALVVKLVRQGLATKMPQKMLLS